MSVENIPPDGLTPYPPRLPRDPPLSDRPAHRPSSRCGCRRTGTRQSAAREESCRASASASSRLSR